MLHRSSLVIAGILRGSLGSSLSTLKEAAGFGLIQQIVEGKEMKRRMTGSRLKGNVVGSFCRVVLPGKAIQGSA